MLLTQMKSIIFVLGDELIVRLICSTAKSLSCFIRTIAQLHFEIQNLIRAKCSVCCEWSSSSCEVATDEKVLVRVSDGEQILGESTIKLHSK